MLLQLMELWVLLDAEAVACCPLLEDFHPGFDIDLLDPIQVLPLADMTRVQRVQDYIGSRIRACRGMHRRTVFDDPTDNCFAARYFDEYDEAGQLLRLESRTRQAFVVSRRKPSGYRRGSFMQK